MLDRVLSDLALVYNIFIHNSLVVFFIQFVNRHNERYNFYHFLTRMYDLLAFQKMYVLMVYFTTFCSIFNILHIVMIGGGGYVVKTYPSIDPIAAPPI